MGSKACLAQRPERRTCNAMVIGSTPIAGYIFYKNKSFQLTKSLKNKSTLELFSNTKMN